MALRDTRPRSGNSFYLRLINPYDPIMWDIDLVFPIYEAPEPIEPPEFTYEDFMTHCKEFYGFIEEHKTLYGLYNALVHVARGIVSYKQLGQDDYMWKYLVSMYVAHHMEMAMARLKNQADEISMTPEKPKEKKIEYHFDKQKDKEYFSKTKYGFAFWSTYEPYLKWRLLGSYTSRSAH